MVCGIFVSEEIISELLHVLESRNIGILEIREPSVEEADQYDLPLLEQYQNVIFNSTRKITDEVIKECKIFINLRKVKP